MLRKRIIPLALVLALMLSVFSVSALAAEGGRDLGDGFELRFDGEAWKIFPVDNLSDVLTLDDLNITVVDDEGTPISADAYELSVETEVGWDEEENCPITEPYTGALTIAGDPETEQAGFVGFNVIAKAKSGSGYTGATRPQEFMIWHKYSFNWFGANATFGENFKRQCTWSWHDYYEIPQGYNVEPEVRGVSMEGVDPQYYTLTYFNRVTGVPVSDSPDYQATVYPETDPLDGMPSELGSYFVRIEGKAPYYGASYIDFDIVMPRSLAMSGPQTAYDGETLYLEEGKDMYVKFDMQPYGGLIPGWRNDLFKATGFGIDDDPTFFDGDDYAYAHISAGDKKVGDTATLYYNWYRPEDIFGEGALGWIDAVPVYSASVVITVAAEPQSFFFLKDEGVRYFDGDTIYVLPDSEFWLCDDLTYHTDWWLADRDLSDLEAKGFTYIERKQFEEAGYVYDRFSTEGLAPGTSAQVSIKSYLFDDFFSGDLSDKESRFPATVTIEVVEPEPEKILGDADGDGEIMILDATAIQRKLAAFSTPNFVLLTADANRNGELDILDATTIQRWLAGFDDGMGIGENVMYGTGFAFWNIEAEVLPEGCALTGAAAERAREEIRGALSLLIDRNAVAASQPGQRKPASSFIPVWMTAADDASFHKDYYSVVPRDYAANVASAVETLKKYYTYDQASGKFTDAPVLVYAFNDSEPVRAIAEEIRRNFAAVGIELELKPYDAEVYFDAIADKEYSFARLGWAMTVNDPINFLEPWIGEDEDSGNSVGFGSGSYKDAAFYSLDLAPYGVEYQIENATWAQTYDVLIGEIKKGGENADELMRLAEDMLMSTGCLIPLFYY